MVEGIEKLVRRLVRITPDMDPSYRDLPDGKWMIHGKIYPVPKLPLGRRVTKSDTDGREH